MQLTLTSMKGMTNLAKMKFVNIREAKCIGGCLLHKNTLFCSDDLLKCFIEAMKRDGLSFDDRYGFDAMEDKLAAYEIILEDSVCQVGNGVIGVDILQKDNDKYFVVYDKPDVLCELSKLRNYAHQSGYKFACYLANEINRILLLDDESIVLEVVNV